MGRLNYVGPSFLRRLVSGNGKNALVSALSVGYTGYRNESKGAQRDLKVKGNSIGLASTIGYDFGIGENIFIGLTSHVIFGILNEVEVDDGITVTTFELQNENRENLSRINLSLALRILL